jgi:hypothetical protein
MVDRPAENVFARRGTPAALNRRRSLRRLKLENPVDRLIENLRNNMKTISFLQAGFFAGAMIFGTSCFAAGAAWSAVEQPDLNR